MAVHFIFDDTKTLRLKKRMIAEWIKNVASGYGKSIGEISYIFCSDNKILAINNEYLQHDYYTDIISFDLSAGDDLVGEIYISIDRVRENARTLGHSFKSELHRVIFHGALHLCGYKDKSLRDIKLMRKKEEESLSAYFA